MNKFHKTLFTKMEVQKLMNSDTYYEAKLDQGKEESLIDVEIAKKILKGDSVWVQRMRFVAESVNCKSIFSAISEVLHAALKENGGDYDKHSWKKVPNAYQRYWEAYRRHEKKGLKNIDINSGLYHYQHMLTNLMFLTYFEMHPQENGGENDM